MAQRSLFKKVKQICVTCHKFEQESNAFRDLKFHLFAIGTGLIFLLADVATGYGWALINLSLFHLLSLITIIIHESGHALAAWLTGQKVIAISFGQGRSFYSTKLLGVYLDFNIIPVEGLTFYGPAKPSFLRIKMMITTLAGPTINLLIAWVIWQQIDPHEFLPAFFNQVAFLQILFISNLFTGCLNLIPFRFNSSVGKIWSDGGKILTLPFLKKEEIESYLKSAFLWHAFFAYQHKDMSVAYEISKDGLKQYPDDPHLKNLSGVILLEQGKPEEALSIFKSLMIDDSASDYEKALFCNNVAYANFLLNDPGLLKESLLLSEKAFSLAPWEPAIRSTRGSILIENNQLEEGIKFLRHKHNRQLSDSHNANIKSVLAMAYAKQGKMELASKTLKKAHELDQDNLLAKRAEQFFQNQFDRENSSPEKGF